MSPPYNWPPHVWKDLDLAQGTHVCEFCDMRVKTVVENGVVQRYGIKSGWRRTDEECLVRMEIEAFFRGRAS